MAGDLVRRNTTVAGALFGAVLASLAAVGPANAAGLIGTRAAHVTSVAPQPSVADVTGVRVEANSTTTNLIFNLSAPVVPKAFVLAGPDRAIVDLPQVDFRIDPSIGHLSHGARGHAPRRGGLVSSYRFGLLSPGRSRIVIDLGNAARIAVAPPRRVGDHYEMAVALTRVDRDAFRAAAQSGALSAASASSAPLPQVVRPAETTTIVLDPGHGGPDTGAMVNGVVEKDVALAFANALAAKLKAHGGFNVVMTRASDVFIPLSERVRIARETGAALMVSIHADTLTNAADISGATVYTVSDRASDAYAAKVAAKENEADATVGVDGQKDSADVNDILFDLTRRETRAYSHVFARTLVNYWKVVGRLNKNPRRAAGFVVLKAPDVPSVLLELGYLSSPSDSADLTSDAWREQATARMAEAIQSYFADRHGAEKAAAGVPMPLKQAAMEPGARR